MENSLFLDRRNEFSVKVGGNLPHWHQNGKMQFVTFRLADSLPQQRVEELNEQISIFRKNNPEPWSDDTKKIFRKIVSKLEQRLLDQGFGSCLLAIPKLRKILSDAIMFKDGVDYEVVAYVIMPNHVHLLIRPFDEHELSDILHSIKRFSARKINIELARIGKSVWMRESYDHLVRNDDELKHCLNYIRNNPWGLSVGEYELYIRS